MNEWLFTGISWINPESLREIEIRQDDDGTFYLQGKFIHSKDEITLLDGFENEKDAIKYFRTVFCHDKYEMDNS